MAARLTAYLVVAIVGATFIAGLMVGAQRDDSDGPVDLIVHNAAVYTADRRGTTADAVAVRGNQILRVGTNRDILRLQRPQTRLIDARGGSVLPGFNDSHVELIRGGLSLTTLNVAGLDAAGDILTRITEWSAANPDAAWVVGRGWSPGAFRNGLPSRQLLDSAVGDRPAVIYGADDSAAWVNTAALRLAGITRRTADPANGSIARDSRTGEPSGVLHGSAQQLVARLVPPPSAEDRAAAVRAAIAEANARGITSVQTADDRPDALEVFDSIRRAGDLTLRIYAAAPVTAPLTPADLERLDAVRQRYPDDPLLKAGALAIRLDSPLASGAAALLQPYESATGPAGAAEAPVFAPDDLNRTVRLADAAGWQVITHASGDRAVRMALTAYAHAARSNRPPARGRRHRIDGLALVDPEDVSRFEPLGIVASTQPCRAMEAGGTPAALQQLLGPERAARAYALRTVARETRMVFGSAWPACDMDPLLGIHVATSGTMLDETREGGVRPAERLQRTTAIDSYTSAAAWASFDEGRKGSIGAGMLADLVVLSDDVLGADADAAGGVHVTHTIFDGRIVYQRTPRAETEPAPSLQH